MKLEKVHFDAYRSLVEVSLDVEPSCIGMVGINESGKSNILRAVQCIDARHPLTSADRPKMRSGLNPQVRFELSLSANEVQDLCALLGDYKADTKAHEKLASGASTKVEYTVAYDLNEGEERRTFALPGIRLSPGTLARKPRALCDGCEYAVEDKALPLHEILTTSKSELKANVTLQDQAHTLSSMRDELTALLKELPAESAPPEENGDEASDATAPADDSAIATDLRRNAEALQESITRLEQQVAVLDLDAKTRELSSNLVSAKRTLSTHEDRVSAAAAKLQDLRSVKAPTAEQLTEITAQERAISASQASINKYSRSARTLANKLEALNEPIESKFDDTPETFAELLGSIAEDLLDEWLPQVVFWTYSDDYILSGETDLDELANADELSEIPRPLLNLFRIGLGVDSLDSLKHLIATIQHDSSERNRQQDILNKRIQEYLKQVWPEYDQEIRISLEREQVLVKFTDPSLGGASYYEMQERSQGCQTFICFLLTVGAEASEGVIRDSILLLDEPETHLHPSGVRFMLAELIKAGSNGNSVLYATHSIFMIDKSEYDRHLIITKRQEQTQIERSAVDRVGYFMQEEVLYDAIDRQLEESMPTRDRLNFVFEGAGDAQLFSKYYNLKDAKRHSTPLKDSSFYQGGKCSTIRRYLKRRPIQLGSTWVFVLDHDEPAADLREFIASAYKRYINADIFIFQYDTAASDVEGAVSELEDLLPEQLTQRALTLALSDRSAAPSDPQTSNWRTALQDSGDPDLKRRFKSHLNELIREQLEGIRDMSAFQDAFPDYFAWIDGVCETLAKPSTAR